MHFLIVSMKLLVQNKNKSDAWLFEKKIATLSGVSIF